MSYLREDTRFTESTLPTINQRARLVEKPLSHIRIGSLEDISPYTDTERHVHFAESPTSTRHVFRESERESQVFYPRPPSPTTGTQNRRQVLEVSLQYITL